MDPSRRHVLRRGEETLEFRCGRHEDLSAAAGASVYVRNATRLGPFKDTRHSTAVFGELLGFSNGLGMTGVLPAAQIGLINVDVERGYDLANSVYLATVNLRAGDVILIEQQTSGVGSCYNYAPVEYIDSVYDAIHNATAQGVTVVKAGGNGSQNLDDPAYGTPFLPKGKPDSGANIVGAGAAPCERRGQACQRRCPVDRLSSQHAGQHGYADVEPE